MWQGHARTVEYKIGFGIIMNLDLNEPMYLYVDTEQRRMDPRARALMEQVYALNPLSANEQMDRPSSPREERRSQTYTRDANDKERGEHYEDRPKVEGLRRGSPLQPLIVPLVDYTGSIPDLMRVWKQNIERHVDHRRFEHPVKRTADGSLWSCLSPNDYSMSFELPA